MTAKEALERLRDLGLTQYEAAVYLGLLRRESAPAGELHALSGVPRTAVYDAVRRLQEKGLVEVSRGRPERYRAVDPELCIETLRRRRAEAERSALSLMRAIPREERSEEVKEAVWVIRGPSKIEERIRSLLRDARKSIALDCFSDSAFLRPYIPLLRGKTKTGVSVRIVGGDDARALARDLPRTEIRIEEAGTYGKRGIGLLVDDRQALVHHAGGPDDPSLALWVTGEASVSLVRMFFEMRWKGLRAGC